MIYSSVACSLFCAFPPDLSKLTRIPRYLHRPVPECVVRPSAGFFQLSLSLGTVPSLCCGLLILLYPNSQQAQRAGESGPFLSRAVLLDEGACQAAPASSELDSYLPFPLTVRAAGDWTLSFALLPLPLECWLGFHFIKEDSEV